MAPESDESAGNWLFETRDSAAGATTTAAFLSLRENPAGPAAVFPNSDDPSAFAAAAAAIAGCVPAPTAAPEPVDVNAVQIHPLLPSLTRPRSFLSSPLSLSLSLSPLPLFLASPAAPKHLSCGLVLYEPMIPYYSVYDTCTICLYHFVIAYDSPAPFLFTIVSWHKRHLHHLSTSQGCASTAKRSQTGLCVLAHNALL